MVSISVFLAPYCLFLLLFVVDYLKSFVKGNWEHMAPYMHKRVLINSSFYSFIYTLPLIF